MVCFNTCISLAVILILCVDTSSATSTIAGTSAAIDAINAEAGAGLDKVSETILPTILGSSGSSGGVNVDATGTGSYPVINTLPTGGGASTAGGGSTSGSGGTSGGGTWAVGGGSSGGNSWNTGGATSTTMGGGTTVVGGAGSVGSGGSFAGGMSGAGGSWSISGDTSSQGGSWSGGGGHTGFGNSGVTNGGYPIHNTGATNMLGGPGGYFSTGWSQGAEMLWRSMFNRGSGNYFYRTSPQYPMNYNGAYYSERFPSVYRQQGVYIPSYPVDNIWMFAEDPFDLF